MTNQMASARQTAELDIDKIRADFPILSRQVNGKPLVYLDSAASAQKPNQVIEALVSAYQDTYSNVHRGLHFLSEASTDAYEAVRGKVAGFIGAASGDEIVLTAGATMSLNLIAQSWAAPRLQAGDEILISIAELIMLILCRGKWWRKKPALSYGHFRWKMTAVSAWAR